MTQSPEQDRLEEIRKRVQANLAWIPSVNITAVENAEVCLMLLEDRIKDIPWLLEQIDQLRAENEMLKAEKAQLHKDWRDTWIAECDQLRAERDEYRKALEEIASAADIPVNWVDVGKWSVRYSAKALGKYGKEKG